MGCFDFVLNLVKLVRILRLDLGGVYHLCVSPSDCCRGSGHLIGHATWFGVFWILGMDLDGSNAKMGMGDTGFLALSLCVWQTFNEEFSLGSRCSLGLCDEIRHSYRFRTFTSKTCPERFCAPVVSSI